jgi:hypothetical protein
MSWILFAAPLSGVEMGGILTGILHPPYLRWPMLFIYIYIDI